MTSFADHFSDKAEGYARYRPTYPPILFRWLAEQSPGRKRAWDCGTGNGQAASGLADWFDEVRATDASQEQVARAEQRPSIIYGVTPAETSGLEGASAELVTVAQAVHWFPLPAFYQEVRRVLVPGGLVAVWCYETFQVAPSIDKLVNHFYRETVGPYWPEERKKIEEHYETLDFPFQEIPAPTFRLHQSWNLDDVIGYLYTWSAVSRYIKKNNKDPLPRLRQDLEPAWGEAGVSRDIHWPVHIRVGRV